MYQKEIEYTDFRGNQRKETFFFNLTKAELTNMYNSVSGGLDQKLEEIISKKDIPKIMENFELILDKSYGVIAPDGRRFMKSPELLQEFKETQAYSDFYMMLVTDESEAAAFINGILPENLREGIAEAEGPKLIQSITNGGGESNVDNRDSTETIVG